MKVIFVHWLSLDYISVCSLPNLSVYPYVCLSVFHGKTNRYSIFLVAYMRQSHCRSAAPSITHASEMFYLPTCLWLMLLCIRLCSLYLWLFWLQSKLRAEMCVRVQSVQNRDEYYFMKSVHTDAACFQSRAQNSISWLVRHIFWGFIRPNSVLNVLHCPCQPHVTDAVRPRTYIHSKAVHLRLLLLMFKTWLTDR